MKRGIITLVWILGATAPVYAQAIPELATWEANMLSFGTTHCNNFAAGTPESNFGNTYYDAQRVYQHIYAYTGNASWLTCADNVEASYRDWYVMPNNGSVPGYWKFTTGLRMDWERDADSVSKSAALLLATNGAYCSDGTPLAWTAPADLSREVAYCLVAYINEELLGNPRRTRLTQAGVDNDFVDQALDHLDQWLITKDFVNPSFWAPPCNDKYYYQPFMVGITVQSLIRFWDLTGDSRVQPAVTTALDTMWTDAWVAADEGMWYENCKVLPTDPWPVVGGTRDLNLLIAPGYAWLYERTGNTGYRDKADALFAGGVGDGSGNGVAGGAWLGGSKQFNQNYIYSFEYVTLRSTSALVITTTSLANGTVGVPYNELILVTGGTTPYTACDETVGSLPAGSPAFASTPEIGGCRITGTPTGAGTTNFTERVTDTAAATDTQALSITVAAAASPVIETTTVPGGVVGVLYSASIVCTGGTPPHNFSVQSGALCLGTSLTASTGVITGTPTTLGVCSYTIRCTDSVAAFDDQDFTNTIQAAVTLIGTANPGSITAVIRFGYSGLDRGSYCDVNVFESTTLVGAGTSAAGNAKREIAISGLTPSTNYTADLTCINPLTVQSISFRTFPATTGNQTVPFQFGAPLPALIGAARITVDCDDDPNMGSPVSVQNTSCGSGCSVNHSLVKGIYFCRNRWQNVSDVVLATSASQALPVP